MTSTALESSLVVSKARHAGMRAGLLRVPLLGKIIGANSLLLIGALIAHQAFPTASMAVQLWIVLVLSFVVTDVLAWLALRPIAQLERTAARVSRGDFSARVPDSPLADRDVQALSRTMNRLLDRVESDRARIQYLAGRAVRARDIEREAIARELRESLAQTAAAISFQVGAAQRSAGDPIIERRLEPTRVMIEELTDEIRTVADTLYPGTLSEFGLVNALHALVRRTDRHAELRVTLSTNRFGPVGLSPARASALYRVADEALRNIVRHAGATEVRVKLYTDGEACLDIEDDGRGMDLSQSDPMQSGLGLFSARAVLALVGGELQVSSSPGLGTRVLARIPLEDDLKSQ